MTYWGEVKNGVVILQNAQDLADGTLVRVEPIGTPEKKPRPGSREAMQRCQARWAGDPQELDQLLTEIQRARDADLIPLRSSE